MSPNLPVAKIQAHDEIMREIKNRAGVVAAVLRRGGHSSGYDRDPVAAFFKAFDEATKGAR